jgi:hypothetical protein
MVKLPKRTIVFALLMTLLAVSAGRAIAAKHNGSAGGSSASLTFSTSAELSAATTAQVTLGSRYYVNGSGFRPNTWVTVGARFGTTYWGSGQTDSSGNITIGPYTADSCGQIVHDAYEMNQHNGKLAQQASATLDVAC